MVRFMVKMVSSTSTYDHTSGVPLGSKKAAGINDCALDLALSLEGGEGLAEYSVRESALSLGVCGTGARGKDEVPLGSITSVIMIAALNQVTK